MVEHSLQFAEFEVIDIDSNGDFSFFNSLNRLRRSLLGLHNKIFPVYVMNTSNNTIIFDYQNAASANGVIPFTTSVTKRTFVTGIQVAFTSNVAADNTEMNLKFYPVSNPLTYRAFTILKQSLTAQSFCESLNFTIPIELQKGSDFFFSNIFTAGASDVHLVVFGYTKD